MPSSKNSVFPSARVSSPPPQPTDAPAPSAGPASSPPTFRPFPNRPPGKTASSFTDPHIQTFDGLYYPCQGAGEFVLVKSRATPFQVQTRFVSAQSVSTSSFSTTAAVAIKVDDEAPIVQVSIPSSPFGNTPTVNSCPIHLHVNNTLRDITTGSGQDEKVMVDIVDNRYIIVTHIASNIALDIKVTQSSSFGCFLSVIAFIPDSYVASNSFVGMLGTPNLNSLDDWMTKDGQPITLPGSSDILDQASYDYCVSNWCIRNAEESIFVYEAGMAFGNYSKCDAPYSGIDFNSASEPLRSLCGIDPACLWDGIVGGGVADAQNALEAQAEADQASTSTVGISFLPTTIPVDTSVNIDITMNAATLLSVNEAASLDGFNIYRLNKETAEREGVPLVTLRDVGSGRGDDTVAGDLIFSNVLALRSSAAGEIFGFASVPIFNGAENAESPLSSNAVSAVRSYSTQSGLGRTGNGSGGKLSFDSGWTDLELTIQYSWPANVPDLDTGTFFLGSGVGYSCGSSSPYLQFSGDDTSTGGTETIIVLVGQAREAREWSNSTQLSLRAGWFSPSQGSGPATVSVFASRRYGAESTFMSTEAVALVIDPGSQNECAQTEVGEVVVDVGPSVTTVDISRPA
jgi:hypothetical protein